MDRTMTDVAVLGGGIAGTAIAYELARQEHDVKVIYRGDDGSSFKNQKWKHSGLLYAPSAFRLAASAWRAYRNSEESDIEAPYLGDIGMGQRSRWDDRRGYLLALNEEVLHDRQQRWHGWRKEGQTCNRFRRLREGEYSRVGELDTFAVGGFLSPDCVMNFPRLIHDLRERTDPMNSRRTFCPGAQVEKVSPGDQGIEILYRERDGILRGLQCRHCVVVIGASAPFLLKNSFDPPIGDLKQNIPIALRASVVLTFEGLLVPTVTAFLMDDKPELKVGGWWTSGPSLVPFEGRTLVCDTRSGAVQPEEVEEVARTEDYQDTVGSLRDQLLADLGKCFRTRFPSAVGSHICIKVEQDRHVKDSPDLEMKVWGPDAHGIPRLFVALPGKASLAFLLAREISDRIGTK